MSDKANRIHHQRGSSLLEGLLAIYYFQLDY